MNFFACRTFIAHSKLSSYLLHRVIDGVAFDGFEAGALDHFDDLLFGHFYFAPGLDRVGMGELAAVEVDGTRKLKGK